MKLREKLAYLLICLGAVGAFSFTFCTKKISCPGFDDLELTSWFPYTNNEQLIFQSSAGETKAFSLKNTLTTAPYEHTYSLFKPATGCFAEKEFKSTQVDSTGRSQFSVSLRKSEKKNDSTNKSVGVVIKGSFISLVNLKEDAFAEGSIMGNKAFTQKLPTVIIANKTFNDVIELRVDTTDFYKSRLTIYQVFYAKLKGIVGYTEYPSLKQWAKQ